MEAMIEVIKRRVSVRNYTDQPIETEKLEQIDTILRSSIEGPFGNKVRIEKVDLTQMDRKEIKSFGTYGFIRGASLFVAGAVAERDKALEDLGYCFEKVILGVTSLGLGTCWLGGTFKRASFARKINVSADEICPVISPVGYARGKRTLQDRILRRMVGSDKRRPWHELFFEGDMQTPLKNERAGYFAMALECLRLGPSASNNQPWRIVKEHEADIFHLFLRRTKSYDRFVSVDLQSIDMGIAMCHFELAAQESGLGGKWELVDHNINQGGTEYIASWKSIS